jgi:oligopeptide/dipeptide ABC transporter ATP-binding protein
VVVPHAETALLSVRGLHVAYPAGKHEHREVVRGVDLDVRRGEIVGLVGESGSGKSQTAFSVLGVLPGNAAVIGGSVRFDGTELLGRTDALRTVRGSRIGYVPQEPMTNLDPTMTIRRQLVAALRAVAPMPAAEAEERLLGLLRRVGIPDAEDVMRKYPHEISGGMAQRVLIAGAVAPGPDLIIADEPTTALDVTIQAQILDLILERKEAMGVGVILITHDLGVVARLADRVCVMYAGRIVEEGTTEAIFADSRHPYTVGLARSIPRLDDPLEGPDGRSSRKLVPIRGMPPRLSHLPSGCPFRVRCDHAMPICAKEYPPVRVVGGTGATEHRVYCHETNVDKIRAEVTEVAS